MFAQAVDWISGSSWSYVIVFGFAVLDAFFPVVPSESLVVIARARSRAQATSTCSS